MDRIALPESPRLRVLSLGAGVQSSTIALMAARGDIAPFDYAIFSDTGWEPTAVYQWLDWLEGQLPYPVIRARRPGLDLGEMTMATARGDLPREGSCLPPLYRDNGEGMLMKQCSKEFKTRIIGREIRSLLGVEPGKRGPKGIAVESALGISLDEMTRMKESEQPFVRNVFPLIDLRMRRHDCLRWMEERQYPKPPKSSCIWCPYRSSAQHRDLRDNAPEDWARAVAFDRAIRNGFAGMEGSAYVHRSCVPLDEVDLSTSVEQGQFEFGFLDECDGVCGV